MNTVVFIACWFIINFGALLSKKPLNKNIILFMNFVCIALLKLNY